MLLAPKACTRGAKKRVCAGVCLGFNSILRKTDATLLCRRSLSWVERVYERCRFGRAQGTERWGYLSPHHSGNFSSCKKAPESWGKVTCNSPQDLIMTKPSCSCSKQMCRSEPWTSLSPLRCVALNANLSCSFPASLRKANHFLTHPPSFTYRAEGEAHIRLSTI